MGQKVNPIGLRVGVIKTWDSIWYADKKTYVKNLHEDLSSRLEESLSIISEKVPFNDTSRYYV